MKTSDAYVTRDNSGALFRNEQKENDGDRDYSGSINIDGTEYWVSGFVRVSKKTGKKYLSLSIKPKSPRAENSESSRPFNDEIPFAPERRG